MKMISTVELYALTGRLAHPQALGGPNTPSALKPLYIGLNNENLARASSLAEAWRSGRPFALAVREEVLALDVDLKEVDRLESIREVLRDHLHVEVASSGLSNPNRHFYVYEPDRSRLLDLEQAVVDLVGAEPIRVNTRLIRPPGTPHRSLPYRSTPVNQSQFWEFYESVVPSPSAVFHELMPSTQELLNTRGADRSNHDHKVMWRLILHGLTDGEIVRLALASQTAFSEKAREQGGPGAALSYLLRSLTKIRPNAVVPDQLLRSRDDFETFLQACADVVPMIPPDAVGGQTGRRVFAAALTLFQNQVTIERPIAGRTLAQEARVAHQTAVNKLEELVQGGFLRRIPSNENWKATTYRLETSTISTYLQAPGGCVTRYVLEAAGTDEAVFMWGALNESARSVWNVLSDTEELSPKDISSLTRVPLSTVQKALKRLLNVGLVERPRHGRYLRGTDQDFGLLAEQLGVDIRAKNQDALYDRQQSGFGWFQLRKLSEQLNMPNLVMDWVPVDSYRFRHWRDGEVVTIDELRDHCSRMNTWKVAT